MDVIEALSWGELPPICGRRRAGAREQHLTEVWKRQAGGAGVLLDEEALKPEDAEEANDANERPEPLFHTIVVSG
jgi:hypothetical protein